MALVFGSVTKFTICAAVAFLILGLFFNVKKLRVRGLLVSNQFFKIIKAPSKRHQNVTPNPMVSVKPVGVKDVPMDVISDGLRLNVSGDTLCPLVPPNLVGSLPTMTGISSLEAVEAEFPDVMSGGRYRPKECSSRHRVAILIPYRNRAAHLKVFIYNLHRVLARQQIDYGVFVIEQVDSEMFNRGKLLNVGVLESLALYDYQCFVFHDVDLVPADDRNVYTCPEYPRHMSVSINGRSGLHEMNFTIHRRPAKFAKYTGLNHVKSKRVDTCIRTLSKWKKRRKADGLNSVQYKRVNLIFKKLYTWIRVDLRLPAVVMPSSHHRLY